jgi:ATPase subunit of ABC transporter with duplicated ATPase domains
MALVRLLDVSFSYSDANPLFSDLNLQFAPGWTGVVGPNGAGKTTLLKLMGREIEPEHGVVIYEPANLVARSCAQTSEILTSEIQGFGLATDGDSRRILGELGLEPSALNRWPTLSPGERRRWQLGAALSANPGLLILDEPSDHLDTQARALLRAALSAFPGVGLIVSHDRGLLDGLVERVVRVFASAARLYRGNYSTARATWEAEERDYQTAHDRLRDEGRKLRRRLSDKRRAVATAMARKSRENRKRGLFDHQVAAPARTIASRTARDITILRRSESRIADAIAGFKFSKQPGGPVSFDFEPSRSPRLLALDANELRVADNIVLRDVHLTLDRDSRVWLSGPNGSGKTTVVKALLANPHVPANRILYLPQELSGEQSSALLESVRALDGASHNRVLMIAAALGVQLDRLLESRLPSPGEARKLMLAVGLGRRVWALLLDEPTNHLDLPAIERLESALMSHHGALLIVTHDETLARCAASTEWRLGSGRVAIRSL